MKLSKDKGLVHYMKVKYDTILCFDILFEDIDKYLEEHGFQIYPTKKEKGTVSFKQVYQHKDFVIQPDDMVRLVFGNHETGTVVMFTATELRMMVEDTINRKVSFGNEEKPSADGEENKGIWDIPDHPMGFRRETFSMYKEPLDSKMWLAKPPEFTPWMKCPVCDGWGSRFDTGPLGSPTNIVKCPCCEKSGVILMCKQTK